MRMVNRERNYRYDKFLNKVNLDNYKYTNKCFYRLQRLEYLLETNQLSDSLRWNN